jgi:hypothetical protein
MNQPPTYARSLPAVCVAGYTQYEIRDKNKPNFTSNAPTKHAKGVNFTPNLPQLCSTFTQKYQKKRELFLLFTRIRRTFTQKYTKKRELFLLFTHLRRTFLYFFQTLYAKQTQLQSAHKIGVYPDPSGAYRDSFTHTLIHSYTHSPIYAKRTQFTHKQP